MDGIQEGGCGGKTFSRARDILEEADAGGAQSREDADPGVARSSGPMDKAPVYGTGDCRCESYVDHFWWPRLLVWARSVTKETSVQRCDPCGGGRALSLSVIV